MIRQDMRARWNVLVQVFDEATGEVLEEQRVHNIVTTVGLTEIGRRVALIAPPGEDQFAVGDGDTAPTLNDTALENQLYLGQISRAEGGASGSVFRFVLPSTELDGSTIKEVGLFTSEGLMIARAVLATPQTKTAGKGIAFIWQWTFANA